MPTLPEKPLPAKSPAIWDNNKTGALRSQKNRYQVTAIPALKDNYVWILHNDCNAYIVDPGEAAPVIDFLQQQNLQPLAILITHRHADHIGGISEILQQFTLPVIGPVGIEHITQVVNEGDRYYLQAFDRHLQVLAIPGHTLEHIAFWCPKDQRLFSGDTIFSAGCGRLLGGTIEQLFCSLQRIAALPDETQIYAAHEYTQSNLRFALSLEPNNTLLVAALSASMHTPTLPTMLLHERQINPFLRCHDPQLQQAAAAVSEKTITDPLELFVYLRHKKDVFR